ncbi:MAG: hypothetical protein HXK85_08415 [Lachnospiraceae bacterium]|nr:hypothetical protein [Lachnospiraceae bacterium]
MIAHALSFAFPFLETTVHHSPCVCVSITVSPASSWHLFNSSIRSVRIPDVI